MVIQKGFANTTRDQDGPIVIQSELAATPYNKIVTWNSCFLQ
jgi:hypothetical protein